MPESEIISRIIFGEKNRSYEGGMRNHIWMDTFKKKGKTALCFFKEKKSNPMNTEFKEKLFNFTAKTKIMKPKELTSSTKISAKINLKIHALGDKINLHY